MSASPTLQDALRLLSLGLAPHWLRPPAQGGKAPLAKDWAARGCPSEQELRATYRPGFNLGLHTGLVEGAAVCVVVVDLDSPEAVTWATGHLPATPIGTVTGKGHHLYYRHPGKGTNLRNKARVAGVAIDIRADGGQVVAAPSIHPSGRVYREETPWTPEALAGMPVFDPEWFPAPRAQVPSPSRGSFTGDREDLLRRASLYLNKIPGAIEGQAGGTHTFKTGAHLIHELGLTAGEAFDVMWSEWNGRCVPPWEADGLHGLRRKVQEAADKAHSFTPGRLRDAERPGRRSPPLPPREPMEETALPLPVRPCTDLGNAERLARRHGADLRYCHPWGKWLIWDGRRWRIDDSGEVQRRAALTMRAILEEARYAESKEARERLARWALSSEAAAKIEAAVKLCRSIPGIPVSPADLDGDPWLLNVSNGVLDLRTGELRRHRREDMITKIAPVHFDSAATCPRWLALLDRSMAQRADLVTFLQRSIGYALTGSVGEQVLLFFHGGGANGKSTILETLLGILGNYAIQAAADLLIERPGESHPTEQADLAGRRLVVCQEAGKGRHCDEALVKRLTGGDTIKARRMREDFWEFFPTHKLFVSANHRPSVRGCDEAIWRRLRLVPFEVAIPAAERDRDLLVKLRAEWPGILAWAVQGCLAWQREGLNAPKEVRAATAAYRREQDHLAGFLRDRCVLDPDARVTRKALREAYEEWCRDNGEAAVSPRALAEMLREHGVKDGKVRHPNTRLPVDGWSGVRPKTEDDQRKDGGQ